MADEKPTMHRFEVAYKVADTIDSIEIDAAYYQQQSPGDDTVVFKDDNHKVVFSIPCGNLGYVRRLPAKRQWPSEVFVAQQRLRSAQESYMAALNKGAQDIMDAQGALEKVLRGF